MSGLCVQLGSTPPQALPTPSPHLRSSGKRSGGLVPLRGPSDASDASLALVGSFKGSLSRSLQDSSFSLGRSLSRGARTAPAEAGGAAGTSAAPAGSAASSASAARPLQTMRSIPKSAAFVKIEGFVTEAPAEPSPAVSPPPSPLQPRALSSLLSRQLSTDRLPVLGSPTTASLLAGAGGDDPMAGLAARLEQAVRVAPVPRPAPMRPARTAVPDNLLEHLQVRPALLLPAGWPMGCLLAGQRAGGRGRRRWWVGSTPRW